MTTATTDRTIECWAKQKFTIPDELRMVEEPKAVCPEGCGMFRIMSKLHGDTRVVWNKMMMEEVHSAKRAFDELVQKGMVPYAVGADSKPAKEIAKFDPTVQEIIFMPIQLIAGG